jgi:hypothetical protein
MPLLGFSNGGKKKKKTRTRKRKICKIVAYGCQTPSAQRRSDQNMQNSGLRLSDTVCTALLGLKYAK